MVAQGRAYLSFDDYQRASRGLCAGWRIGKKGSLCDQAITLGMGKAYAAKKASVERMCSSLGIHAAKTTLAANLAKQPSAF